MGPGYRVRPLTRVAFDVLVAAGLYDGAPVELLQGEVVEMAPQGPQRSDAIRRTGTRLTAELVARFGERYLVGQQTPLAATPSSEPEPDLSIVENRSSSPTDHPTTALLAIEVAVTSHRVDLVRKPELYAAAAVPQYWVVDLVARQVVVHTDPHPADGVNSAGYDTVRRLPLDTELDVLGISVRLSDIIG